MNVQINQNTQGNGLRKSLGSELEQETEQLRMRATTAWTQAAQPVPPCPHAGEPRRAAGTPGHLGAVDKVASGKGHAAL